MDRLIELTFLILIFAGLALVTVGAVLEAKQISDTNRAHRKLLRSQELLDADIRRAAEKLPKAAPARKAAA